MTYGDLFFKVFLVTKDRLKHPGPIKVGIYAYLDSGWRVL